MVLPVPPHPLNSHSTRERVAYEEVRAADITPEYGCVARQEVKQPADRKRLPVNPAFVVITPVLSLPVNSTRLTVRVQMCVTLESSRRMNGKGRGAKLSAVEGSISTLYSRRIPADAEKIHVSGANRTKQMLVTVSNEEEAAREKSEVAVEGEARAETYFLTMPFSEIIWK